MLSNEAQAVAMAAVRDQLIEAIRLHETASHDGKACPGNRAGAIAYLAHSLLLDDEAWNFAQAVKLQYDSNCQDASCAHYKRGPHAAL